MGIAWTEAQKQVIDARHSNVLVAAGAGSGKTAVLVARIMSLIMDPEHPMDVDELLIVTFTKAAAGEMRERMIQAIEKRREQEPNNEHLLRQTVLVHNAQITTIDGFCMEVIKNNFFRLDLEPGFRVGDEGEFKLLKAEVATDVLTGFYEEKEDSFLEFIENYASGKNDSGILDKILTLYEFAMGNPRPDHWLSLCETWYQCSTKEDFLKLPVVRLIEKYVTEMVNQCFSQMCRAVQLAEDGDGPQVYAPLLLEEAGMLRQLSACSDYESYQRQFLNVDFKRLPGARNYQGDLEKKETVKNMRDEVKKTIKTLKELFFFESLDELLEDHIKTGEMVQVLIQLTRRFMQAFQERKKQLNVVDFTDMEHFALEVLVDGESGTPTETAEEYREQFREIMIDEYQDSNLVQEILLNAVSGCSKENNNIFMVGDVKQSIYRFRLARPELFMEKYDSYTLTDSPKRRIDLHQNFRSRDTVIQTVNDIFKRIMRKDLGNVEYDEAAELKEGAEYPKSEEDCFQTELYLCEDQEEARIAQLVLQQREKTLVTDKKTGQLRPASYSDIVILLRNPASRAERLVETLKNNGIAAHAASKTGYFSAEEVSDILSLLKIIDNKKQDIPLAAALTSPFGGFSPDDLAEIKQTYKEERFFDAYGRYTMEKENTLGKKLREFNAMLDQFRDLAQVLPVHELIRSIYVKTGYLNNMMAKLNGENCLANLEMLMEKAIAFEKTSYHGVLGFLNYIDQLKKYSVDYGGGSIVSEGEDAVSIMSIHGSKGLEFPIVIVAGLGKRFNLRDAASSLILHPDYGIGMDCLDGAARTKKKTLIRNMMSKQIIIENLGEELRVLYVALTRAKEKLILIGSIAKMEMKEKSWKRAGEEESLSFMSRLSATSYLDWIMPAVYAYPEKYQITIFDALEEEKEQTKKEHKLTLDFFLNQLGQPDPDIFNELKEKFSYCYPFETSQQLKMKVSVSELKQRAMQGRSSEEECPIVQEEPQKIIPKFLNTIPEEIRGALGGTALHRFLECYDFTKEFSKEELQSQLNEILKKKRMSEEQAALLNQEKIMKFLKSKVAVRIQNAARTGRLHKEQPFVLGIKASEIEEQPDTEEIILVQGIIDVYWEEGEALVLLDYKTDHIKEKAEFLARYEKQMELYARALTQATGKKVAEKIIYSFAMESEIFID
ncbi:MAG: helicase-exonuclease AddAB subunit AddA [Lachnospiraceae bacterium]